MKKIISFLVPTLFVTSLVGSFSISCSKPINYYLVTFNTDGGTFVKSESIAENQVVAKPTDPTKVVGDFAYTFDGWYDGETKFDFNTPITKDITLTAKWLGTPPYPEYCLANFDSDGGTYVSSQWIKNGLKITKPADPTKVVDGFTYTFGGWYKGETPFDFNTPITNHITLKAKWLGQPLPKTYHLKFVGTNCTISGSATYEEDILRDVQTTRTIEPKQGYELPVMSDVSITGEGASSISYSIDEGIIYINNLVGDATITAVAKPTKCQFEFTTTKGTIQGETSLTIDSNTLWKDVKNKPIVINLDEGYVFVGWGLTPTTTTPISDTYVVHESLTLYAIITPEAKGMVTFSSVSLGCTLQSPDGKTYTPGMSFISAAIVEVSFKLSPNENYLPVFALGKNLIVTNATNIKIDNKTGTLTMHITKGDVCTIVAKGIVAKEKLEDYSWEEINCISLSGIAPYIFYIGDTKTVKVNGVDHKTRILGFNHDELETSTPQNPQYAGISFEFANLISDSDGYTLATPWCWDQEIDSKSNDFENSNIRQALDGQGSGKLCWYQQGSQTQSKQYTKSVIEMLNDSDSGTPALVDVIKTVKKPILTGEDFALNSYNTKLFILSQSEMGSSSNRANEGTTYELYEDGIVSIAKTQVNGFKNPIQNVIHITDKFIIPEQEAIANYYYPSNYSNIIMQGDKSEYYFLRTASYNSADRYPYQASYVYGVGKISRNWVFDSALGIAPAFCI